MVRVRRAGSSAKGSVACGLSSGLMGSRAHSGLRKIAHAFYEVDPVAPVRPA
jgi:hypothetical protein